MLHHMTYQKWTGQNILHILHDSLLTHVVRITKKEDYSTYKGTVVDVDEIGLGIEKEKKITVQKSKNNSQSFTERMIRFLEVLK